MTMRFSLSYSTDLEDKLAAKSYLGHYANEPMPKEHGRYEADRGWDALFANYLEARDGRHVGRRAGATSKDEAFQPVRGPRHEPELGPRQPDQRENGEGSHLQEPNA